MSVLLLVQVFVNLLFLLGFLIIWLRLKRPAKDDPRLSRGLQLLQSKITVLEDLSDRTDKQVSQLTNLLDQKTRLLQSKIFDAENQIQKVQGSMDRSLEVAEIFQDKIPHDEIIDRQNTVKYIHAARLAHSGKSVDEIIQEVDLPREQVEFIAKVNKDKLMFDDDKLPAWAQKKQQAPQLGFELEGTDFNTFSDEDENDVISTDEYIKQYSIDPTAFDLPQTDYDSLKKLGAEFRQACDTYDKSSVKQGHENLSEPPSQIYQTAKDVTKKIVNGVSDFIAEPFHRQEDAVERSRSSSSAGSNIASQVILPAETGAIAKISKPDAPTIQRVVFPRIDLDDNLG